MKTRLEMDLDHTVVPESGYGDELYDNCSRCGEACTSDGRMHGTDDERNI